METEFKEDTLDDDEMENNEDSKMEEKISDDMIIGCCLVESFREQICEMLRPGRPDFGAYLLESNLKGNIASTSTISQKISGMYDGSGLLVAMSMVQLPNHTLMLEKIHPIDYSWLPDDIKSLVNRQSLSFKECFSRNNIGSKICDILKKEFLKIFASLKKDDIRQFITCLYDNTTRTFSIFAPESIESEVSNIAEEKLKNIIDKKLSRKEKFYNDSITLGSGLQIIEIKFEENATKKGSEKLSDCNTIFIVTINRSLEDCLRGHDFPSNYKLQVSESEHKLVIKNICKDVTDSYINSAFVGIKVKAMKLLPIKNNLRGCFQWFHDIDSLQQAMGIWQSDSLLCKGGEFISPNFKGTNYKHNSVVFSNEGSKTSYRLHFSSFDDTCNFFSNITNRNILAVNKTDGIMARINKVKLSYPDKFKNLQEMIKQIEKMYKVDFKAGKQNNNSKRKANLPGKKKFVSDIPAEFYEICGSPEGCKNAFKAFKKSTVPLKTPFRSRSTQRLVAELHKTNWFQKQEKKFNLAIKLDKFRNTFNSMTIFGDMVEQGTFMRAFMDESSKYEPRYSSILVGNEGFIFSNDRVGAHKLEELNQSDSNILISYFAPLNIIEFEVSKNYTGNREKLISKYKEKVNAIRSANSGNEIEDDFEEISVCIWCEKVSELSFTLCGHNYCENCLTNEVEQNNGSLLKCIKCDQLICWEDILDNFTRDKLEKISVEIAKKEMRTKNYDFMFCPLSSCKRLVPKNFNLPSYSECPACKKTVCWKCGNQAYTHLNRTCREFRKFVKNSKSLQLEEIFQRAKEFVAKNWLPTVGANWQFQINPGLQDYCPSMRKYLHGMHTKLGDNAASEENYFFAWHGTNLDAIGPICYNGFDPNRRSGQAYGPGEYFGQTPGVSAGYVRNCGYMIVAQLIKLPETTTHGNFCYVVNNPKNWESAYNLPVGVVRYNNAPLFDKFIPSTQFTARQIENIWKTIGLDIQKRSYVFKSPFAWSWQENNQEYKFYTDTINEELENGYQEFLENKSLSIITLEPLISFLDDRLTEYVINFETMKQTRKVGAVNARNIKRERIDLQEYLTDGQYEWVFLNDYNQWEKFQNQTFAILETNFRKYIDGDGTAIITFQTPGRQEDYQVNFVKNIQINLSTKKERTIGRRPKKELQPTTYIIKIQNHDIIAVEKLNDPAYIQQLVDKLAEVSHRAFPISENETSSHDIETPEIMFNSIDLILSVSICETLCLIADIIISFIRNELFSSFNIYSKVNNQTSSRLEKLTSIKLPEDLNFSCRNDCILFLAHTAIWNSNSPGTIYGSIINKWIMYGEDINSFHVYVPGSMSTMENILTTEAKYKGVDLENSYSLEKGDCCIFTGSWEGNSITVYLHNKPPICESDISSLAIDANKSFHCFAGETSFPLYKALTHCKRRKFVFFLDLHQNDTVKKLIKLLSNNWTCISTIPSTIIDSYLSEYSNLLRPKVQYNYCT